MSRTGRWLVVLSLAMAACSAPAASLPADTAATLAANITEVFADADWYDAVTIRDGRPWVEVDGTIAFVHFAPRMDGAPIAMAVCRSIAAATNDPDTAKPLGITSVVVYANGHNSAQCFPP